MDGLFFRRLRALRGHKRGVVSDEEEGEHWKGMSLFQVSLRASHLRPRAICHLRTPAWYLRVPAWCLHALACFFYVVFTPVVNLRSSKFMQISLILNTDVPHNPIQSAV